MQSHNFRVSTVVLGNHEPYTAEDPS